jgi:hypothetical protein
MDFVGKSIKNQALVGQYQLKTLFLPNLQSS